MTTRLLPSFPHHIEDLHAREALLASSAILLDEFREALLEGQGQEYVLELVPPAFRASVDESLLLRFYAAAVALMVRLGDGDAAGSVAEEIVAVSLLDEAKVWLDMRRDDGQLSEPEAENAMGSLRGIFELFQDDDVLRLFEMKEPADAAAADYDPVSLQLGIVDQRIAAWFRPFGGVAPVGYLDTDDAH